MGRLWGAARGTSVAAMRRALVPRALPLCLLALAGCGDPAFEDYPRLLPVEQVLAEPVLPAHAAADPAAVQGELKAGRDALKARAAGRPAGTGDLAARAAALQARAAQIRAEACAEAKAAGQTRPDCPS